MKIAEVIPSAEQQRLDALKRNAASAKQAERQERFRQAMLRYRERAAVRESPMRPCLINSRQRRQKTLPCLDQLSSSSLVIAGSGADIIAAVGGARSGRRFCFLRRAVSNSMPVSTLVCP